MTEFIPRIRIPEFPAELRWFNVERPLVRDDLLGRVAVLDFWTSGCINCQHMLPLLDELAATRGPEVVVVGVHSPKFPAEADAEGLRRALRRLGVRHPVVNDPEMLLWRTFQARTWPSVFLVDPGGHLVARHFGELPLQELHGVVDALLQEWQGRGELSTTPLAAVDDPADATGPLRFPERVLAGPDHLFVADTGHHRLVALVGAGEGDGVAPGGPGPRDGDANRPDDGDDTRRQEPGTGEPSLTPVAVVGGPEPGFRDGPAAEARFRNPRGMARVGDALFVADTGNHALRRLDLARLRVETVAGTAEPAPPGAAGGEGPVTPLRSPWDLVAVDGHLVVAMAGSHQLWRYDLDWGEIVPWVGSGVEAVRDGDRQDAALAQPSGLALRGDTLYVVDAESSSVRRVDLADGRVTTLVGGGLFEFGDVDGEGDEARLQHPTALAWLGGRLVVSDTYNHKLRRLDPETRRLDSWRGGGPGHVDGPETARFREPGGLSAVGDRLWVADTGNHALRRVDARTGRVAMVRVAEPAASAPSP